MNKKNMEQEERQDGRISELKLMLEMGVINEEEFDKLSNKKTSGKKRSSNNFLKSKWFYLIASSILLLLFLVYFFLSSNNSEKAAITLSEKFVSFQLINNTAYINALNDVLEKIIGNEYTFVAEIDSVLAILESNYQNGDFNSNLEKSSLEYNELEINANKLWPKSTSSGKEFWLIFDQKVQSNSELNKIIRKQGNLLTEIKKNKSQLSFASVSELNEMKQNIYYRLDYLFNNWKENYFDPYEYFSYKIEHFFDKKNILPRDLQPYINNSAKIGEAEFSPIQETLSLKSKEGDFDCWEFATDYKFYNENLNTYLTCNKWFNIKINSKDKIVVFKEIRTENIKTLSVDEYNAIEIGE